MRMLKILFITPILIYGGAMGYLWYEVRSNTEEMIQSAAPVAAISYDSIHLSPLGDEIGLNNLIIRPTMVTDEFRIEQVRINAPHIGYFLNAHDTIQKGGMPENLGIQLRRVHIDLNGDLFTMLATMQQQASMGRQNPVQQLLLGMDAVGCGEKESFSLDDYRRMGLGNIVTDLALNMKYDEQLALTRLTLNFSADQLQEVELLAEINATPEGMQTAMSSNTLPQVSLNYRDTGYYQLRNKYCAGLNASTAEAYVEQHIRQLGAKLGATFPQEIVTAYTQLMLNGGSLKASFNPANDTSLNGLGYYKPADVMNMLGVQISINNSSLNNDEIQWGQQATASAPDREPSIAISKDAPRPSAAATTQPSTVPRTASTIQVIDVADAGKYLHRVVEVTTHEGKVRSGILNEVTEGSLHLLIKLRAGSISYPVAFSDISKLRVR